MSNTNLKKLEFQPLLYTHIDGICSFFAHFYLMFFFLSPKLISIIFCFLIECAKHICVVYKSSCLQLLPATEKKKRIPGNTQIVTVIPDFFQQEAFKKKTKTNYSSHLLSARKHHKAHAKTETKTGFSGFLIFATAA